MPPSPIETPAKKVARLRAARLAEKEARVSRWDMIVVRGRVWADRAHKATVIGLVGFSAVAACITAFALTDMIMHNRRKRNAFYAEQHALYGARLIGAIEAEKAGLELDEDQILVLNRERAKVQAEEARKQRSWAKSIKGLLMGGLKQDEAEGEREAGKDIVVPTEGQVLGMMGMDQAKILKAVEHETRDGVSDNTGDESRILHAVEEKRRREEGKLSENQSVKAGSMAETVVEKAKSKASWMSWGRRS